MIQLKSSQPLPYVAYTHTHTHIYIYILIPLSQDFATNLKFEGDERNVNLQIVNHVNGTPLKSFNASPMPSHMKT